MNILIFFIYVDLIFYIINYLPKIQNCFIFNSNNENVLSSSYNNAIEPFSKRNTFPVPDFDSNCLIMSSCFFIIPSIYAFIRNIWWLGLLSFITALISINYWRYAIEGFRRNIDLFFSKFSFTIYFISGIYYIQNINIFLALPICVMIIFCYYMSNKIWNDDSYLWVFYHISFHFFVCLEQCIVINAINVF
jgi:hypothetical protein